MTRVLDDLRRAAEKDATILLLGESGTGKDVLAVLAHQWSPRRLGPFITLDCGAIAPSLIEAELFGHTKGIFTGANSARVGLAEAADQGRLFLNEVGDSSPELQKCFLDLVQHRRFRKLGEVSYTHLNVAFVAGTHRDLRKLAKTGTFRFDLYQRLRVVEVRIPPLRERQDEFPAIVRTFLAHYCHQASRSPASLDDETLGFLMRYSWPGNLRELAHCIECVVIRTSEDRIDRRLVEEFIDATPDPGGPSGSGAETEECERDRIQEALRQHGGNRLHTAKALGMHRATLYRKLNRLNLMDAPRAHSQDRLSHRPEGVAQQV